MGQTSSGDVITIKKYANRRLYDTSTSQYVTLDYLRELVKEGKNFRVIDAKSSEDLTRSVLAQIIFEEESRGANLLPVDFLRQLISFYGDSLQSVVPGYLEASMETFTRHQEEMREQVGRMFGANPAMENLEAMTRKNMEWFDQAMRMFSPFPQSAPEPRTKAEPKPEERSDELGALKDQLAEMQRQLNKLSRD